MSLIHEYRALFPSWETPRDGYANVYYDGMVGHVRDNLLQANRAANARAVAEGILLAYRIRVRMKQGSSK